MQKSKLTYYTRNNARQNALGEHPSAYLSINDETRLDEFVSFSQYKPELAAAVLHLNLRFGTGKVLLHQLRHCLLLCENITTLELVIGGASSRNITQLLRDARFPRLVSFSTNASHEAVASFLGEHPRLFDISIGRCESAANCTLRTHPFPNLSTVAGPLASPSSPSRHVHEVKTHLTKNVLRSPTRIFKKLTPPGSHISRLTMDFYPSDVRILRKLSAIEGLRILKLIERPWSENETEAQQMVRPWSNVRSWARDLRALDTLERLLIRTRANLVTTSIESERKQEERQIISSWTKGEGRYSLRDECPHLKLRRVTLWYLADSVGQVMSYWDKHGGEHTGSSTNNVKYRGKATLLIVFILDSQTTQTWATDAFKLKLTRMVQSESRREDEVGPGPGTGGRQQRQVTANSVLSETSWTLPSRPARSKEASDNEELFAWQNASRIHDTRLASWTARHTAIALACAMCLSYLLRDLSLLWPFQYDSVFPRGSICNTDPNITNERLAVLEGAVSNLQRTNSDLLGMVEALLQERSPSESVNLPDFASRAAGATINHRLTLGASTKRTWLDAIFPPNPPPSYPPETILAPNNPIGTCWRFNSASGQIAINLPEEIVISHISIAHAPPSPSTFLTLAPRTIVLWGLVDVANEHYEGGTGPAFRGEADSFVLLHTFQYDIYSAQATQTFMLPEENRILGVGFRIVVIEVVDNWGDPSATCLYHVGVHGEKFALASM
ncbi:hypothetical protein CONPUDRAFT_75469 [Coniophora puteana RWD-64-598 SS2]|uniref:SUN domain-containing protein n=1 Tax=Coniophora puteana (strain RWD-64-598) TaxID=741705 RepID=A0A5M3MEJ3_CONPW|nr:uncharacterized protein CONPUDRAFT_75469 [Coniophora puteana RWD-64-598 SS2]EIW77638.1 hypothetical protein CONPUDRAFT_75469 [Coniophora puteana RWD-64-598 SS2]